MMLFHLCISNMVTCGECAFVCAARDQRRRSGRRHSKDQIIPSDTSLDRTSEKVIV